MPQWKFDLGIKAKSVTTGFEGVLTSRSEHLNSCNRYWVQPLIGKDKKYPDGLWIDEGDLVRVGRTKIKPQNQDSGGFASKIK